MNGKESKYLSNVRWLNMAEQVEKKNKLFREKSLERLESPEKLNDYLRVTSPGVWLVLAAVIALLIGICIWGVFGRITATAPVAVVTKDGESTCLVPANALEGVIKHHTVTVDGKDLQLQPDVLTAEVVAEDTNIYIILAGKLAIGDIVYPISLAEPLGEDGIVSGTLVTETLSPAALFFNQ